MFKLSNIRIGTKLAIMSGLGVVLVAVMLAIQVTGNSAVRTAVEKAAFQQRMAHDLEFVRVSVRGMEIAVGNLSSAQTKEVAQKATESLMKQLKTAHQWLDPIPSKLHRPEDRALAEKIVMLVDQFAAGAKEIAASKAEASRLGTKDDLSTDDTVRMADLNDKALHIAQDRAQPIALQIDGLLQKMAESTSNLASSDAKSADNEMVWVQRLALAFGAPVILALIGSAVFGIMSIGKPLRKMSGVLIDLTNDRIVDVPYTDRGDEVGDIAKATEVFKQSIAEKVINLRVRSGLDVVKSNVMIADGDYNIMYMNTALQEMMREAESEMREVLPNFEAGKLLGANMDVFHKSPDHQRRLLDSLTSVYESHITVGSQKFHLVATPVIDDNGKRSGTVVEWRDETVEKAIEAEVDGLVKAVVAGDFSQRVPLEGKKEFMLNLATSMNALCENTGKALQDLIGMLSALADGDLTNRIDAEYRGMFGELKNDANKMAERIGATIAEIKASAAEVTNASAEISTSTTDLSQRTEEQAASLEETSASMEEIASTVKKNAENAQAGQSVGQQYPRRRRPRRPGGRPGGRGYGQDRGILAQDLRHHRRHRRDRPADQPAGAQRRGGSRARRRSRPRLCGRRLRSAQPGAALLAGRQGHQGPDHQLERSGQGRRRAGQSRRRGADRDRRIRSRRWPTSSPTSPMPATSRRPASSRSTRRSPRWTR